MFSVGLASYFPGPCGLTWWSELSLGRMYQPPPCLCSRSPHLSRTFAGPSECVFVIGTIVKAGPLASISKPCCSNQSTMHLCIGVRLNFITLLLDSISLEKIIDLSGMVPQYT